METIQRAAHYRGSIVYKVKYRNNEDGKCKTEWVYSGNLPEDIRKAFHISKLKEGARMCHQARA